MPTHSQFESWSLFRSRHVGGDDVADVGEYTTIDLALLLYQSAIIQEVRSPQC